MRYETAHYAVLFIFFRPTYPERSVLELSQSTFFLSCDRPSFTPVSVGAMYISGFSINLFRSWKIKIRIYKIIIFFYLDGNNALFSKPENVHILESNNIVLPFGHPVVGGSHMCNGIGCL
jgi:hypothetical protein